VFIPRSFLSVGCVTATGFSRETSYVGELGMGVKIILQWSYELRVRMQIEFIRLRRLSCVGPLQTRKWNLRVP